MQRKFPQRTFNEERVKQNFSDASTFYDYWAKFTESRAVEQVLRWANIKEDEAMLEVGTGTGLLLERILAKKKHGFTAGIDLSPDMLAKAEQRINKYEKKQNVTLKTGSAYEISFGDETFDCLISCYMLDLLPEEDFNVILKEFKRVLKPGGRLVLASMSFGKKWYHHFWIWMTRTFPDVMTDCRPVDLAPFVKQSGFRMEMVEKISQHTFPSQVIKAVK